MLDFILQEMEKFVIGIVIVRTVIIVKQILLAVGFALIMSYSLKYMLNHLPYISCSINVLIKN